MTIQDYLLNGKLRAYSSVGCYPILYLDSQGSVLCSTCADEERESIKATAINWENPQLFCDGCSQRIESAYAEAD